jgi:hypothetical protein
MFVSEADFDDVPEIKSVSKFTSTLAVERRLNSRGMDLFKLFMSVTFQVVQQQLPISEIGTSMIMTTGSAALESAAQLVVALECWPVKESWH